MGPPSLTFSVRCSNSVDISSWAAFEVLFASNFGSLPRAGGQVSGMSSNNATVITQSQLDSIRAQFSEPQKTHAAADRQRRKELSTLRAAKWPNTIEAQRVRKEQARIQAMEQAEAERVKEDERQSRIRAEERRMQIERASKMLYDQTDRVKGLHAKMLHSDVIQENQKQIEFKKHVSTIKRELDEQFLAQQREALEIAEQAELIKMEERRQAALAQKAIQLEQLEETKRKIIAERQQRMVEGQMLLEAAGREKQKEIEAALKRREESQQRNLDMLRANDALLEYRRVQAERERLADEQVAAYAAHKAALIEERKRREMQRQADKDQKRDRMIAYMEANMEEERQKNESILKMQEDDSEAKRAAEMAERNRQRAELQLAIDKSRAQQLELREKKKLREREEDAHFSAAWSVRLQELKEEDEQEKADRLAAQKLNQSLLERQMHQKSMRKKAIKEQQMQEAFASRLQLAEEDQMFDEYAGVCMEEWSKKGKDIRPMTISLRKTKAAMNKGIIPVDTRALR